ncbi:MAG: thymidine kinase [Candidatus Eremiobacteraeota bacterium]|nr:thymidine kinase [Candidatus Eremiobacteraeota bacterium]
MAKLYFRYSAMNAGKSTALLQVAHNYEELGRAVWIYTSALDNRYGVGVIASRLGLQRRAATFDATFDFYELLASRPGAEPACLLVDEAQFLTVPQVRQLHRVAHLLGIPVICYGIRSDFVGEPFAGAAYLLTLADSLEELKTVCSCGKKATMNPRIDDAGNRIVLGEQIGIEGEHRYVPMCGRCFYEVERVERGGLSPSSQKSAAIS